MAGKIFINYRREDAQDAAARVHRELAPAFGAKALFMDVDNLLAGQRFDKELDKALGSCDVFLAVIGPRWLAVLDERQAAGKRDYVREEIAAALKREIHVIPVLVNSALLPLEGQLPADIADLIKHQQHEVRHAHFGRDMQPLVAAIKVLRRPVRGGVPWRGIAAGAVVAGGIVAAGLWWGLGPKSNPAADQITIAAPAKPDLAAEAVAKRKADEQARAEAANKAATAEADRKGTEAEAAVKAQAKADEAERQLRQSLLPPKAHLPVVTPVAPAKPDPTDEGDKLFKELFREPVKAQPPAGTAFHDDGCPGGCPEMVALPQGKYLRGSPDSEAGRSADEGPQKTVTIGYDLAVGKYEITRDQFEAFVKATGFKVADQCEVWTGRDFEFQPGSFRQPGFDQAGDHPAVCISWDDAAAYATWLAETTGKPYRLLTEAEWEYAARGITEATPQPRYSYGNDAKTLCEYANGADLNSMAMFADLLANHCKDGYIFTAPVDSFKPNAFGLYNTIGNAWEWVRDCYAENYDGAPTDGTARKDASTGCRRVLRGGSYILQPDSLRAAVRFWDSPAKRGCDIGFRVARTF